MPRQPKPWFRSERNAWFCRIGGKQVKLCEGKDGHAEAVKIFHRMMAAEGKPVVSARMTVAELFDLFLDHVQRSLKPMTYDYYRMHLNGFAGRHGRVIAAQLKPLHVSTWLDSHPKWGQATRRGAITAVRRATAWAKQEGYLEVDPIVSVRRPAMPRRAALLDDDAAKMLGAIKTASMRELVSALIETGARPGEISGLEAKDVDFEAGSARVRGKMGERTIFPSPEGMVLFRSLAAIRPKGPLLLSPKGLPWDRNRIRLAFRRLREKTGVKIATAYSFRARFGTLAIERGVDSILVAELMGHKDTKMLMDHYHNAKAETLKRAAAKATSADQCDGGAS